jgi:hypothetical protein
MAIRLIILILLFSACRSSDMACPEVKVVKLKKRPSNYLLRSSQRSMTASNRQEEKEKSRVDFRPQVTRNVKTIESIDEWDCPKPGGKVIPRSVKENIKKNRKKFETYYRTRTQADSVQGRTPGNQP